MERSCVNCAVKSTCLKRSMSIFVRYIQTGRSNELTAEIKENFNCAGDSTNWKRKKEDEAIGVSRSTAYRIIKRLNQELENKGYITVSGKVSKKYFADRFYGGAELMKPQPYVLNERRVA